MLNPNMFLNQTHVLRKASVFSDPEDEGASLPIVYGDMSGGDIGLWEIPCISKSGFVYCYSDCRVAEGTNNSVKVFVDDVLQTSGYTFTPFNWVYGNISTITFTSDQEGKKVTVNGKGKNKLDGTVMTNIIDIVEDFLVTIGWDKEAFDYTRKKRAWNQFEVNGFKAAGVIYEDKVIWDLIQEMLSSFLGYARLDSRRKLCFEIEPNAISYSSDSLVRLSDFRFSEARQSMENLINSCPVKYFYNLDTDDFSKYDDGETTKDVISQSEYGIRACDPFELFWCYDDTSVANIQTMIVTKFKNPIWRVVCSDISLRNIHIENGDRLVIPLLKLYDKVDKKRMMNQILEVISTSRNLDKLSIDFEGFVIDGIFLQNDNGSRNETIF